MKSILYLGAFSLMSIIDNAVEDKTASHIQMANKKALQSIKLFKEKCGVPGIATQVNVNGRYQINTSVGYCDDENSTKCRQDAVMRIASISKSFTAIIAAKLVEEGLLDLDEDINTYLMSFPPKTVSSKKVSISCRHLLSHRSGIRHYKMKEGTDAVEYEDEEFLNKTRYTDTLTALKLFQDDDLVFTPGEKYLYSSPGYVLLSVVLEAVAAKSKFYLPKTPKKDETNAKNQSLERMFGILFQKLDLNSTQCEYHEKILPNRSRQYRRNCKSHCLLESAPYVDNSCKWASGGLVSTCQDLCKFVEHLVKIWIGKIDGVISQKSLRMLWTPVSGNETPSRAGLNKSYGLGWCIKEKDGRLLVGHTGGASGGTSALQINLSQQVGVNDYVIVSILCNMENLSDNIEHLAEDISRLYEDNDAS